MKKKSKLSILSSPLFVLLFIAIAFTTTNAQLTGIKTIPGSYATLAAAITDLNTNGVGSGGVTFNIAAGYTETFALPTDGLITATGTSANPIIFQKFGSGNNPVITAGVGAGTTDGIIIIAGGDYITFDGINVSENSANTTTTTQMEWGYALVKKNAAAPFDGCQYVTIKNCNVTLNNTNTASEGIHVSNHIATSTTSLTITATTDAHNNILISNCGIANTFVGVLFNGYAASSPYDLYDQNNSVINCTISNFGLSSSTTATYGIRGVAQNNFVTNGNNINNTANGGSAHGGAIYGISVATGTTSNFTARLNTINLSKGTTSSATYGISNAFTGNIIISNNILQNFVSGGSSGVVYFIYNSSSTNSIAIDSNTIGNSTSLNTTGSIYGIYNSSSSTIVNVRNNSVKNLTRITGTTGAFYGYYNLGSPAGGTETIANNVVANINNTISSGVIYGMYSGTATAQAKDVNNNTVDSLFSGTGAIYGIYMTYSNPDNVYQNTVFALAGGGTVYGINFANSSTTVGNCYQNLIYNLSSTGASSAVYGLYVGGGTTIAVYRNRIYDVSESAAGGLVYGLYVSSGTTVNLHNNFVSDLKAPSATGLVAVNGIYIAGGTTVGVYYNTVYLNATSSSTTTFGTSGIYKSSTTTGDYRNNVVVNTSTPGTTGGLTVANRWSGTYNATYYASTSDRNCFFAGTPGTSNLIFYDGTNSLQTIAEYKTLVSGRDAGSFRENPPFVNVATTPYDLHMKTNVATQCESGGTPVTTPIAISVDYDGEARNTVNPDVGADEFFGQGIDLTPPSIVYTPLGNTSSTTTRTLYATITDFSGVPVTSPGWPNLYWRKTGQATYTPVTPTAFGGNTFTFIFGAGVATGDTVYYYIVAQDSVAPVPNVGSFPAGASGFTYNPPAATNPPPNPSSYMIVQAPLSGNITVGISAFNSITGRNITFAKSINKVMKEVVSEAPVLNKADKKGDATETSMYAPGTTQMVEVEEVSWIPMENGHVYEGPLYVKKSENPELNFPDNVLAVYATITAAVADLNLRGVSAATNFLLIDTIYANETLPIVINVTSESKPTATNLVTIKPNTGVNTVISLPGASTQVFKILTSYVTIDGSNSGGTSRNLTIENTSTTTPQVVVIGSTGTTPIVGVTVKNCNLINGVNTSSALVVSDGTTPGNAGYFNNITIRNNTIQKAYIGAYCNAVVATGNGKGLLLTENNLTTLGANSVRYCGIYLQGVDSGAVTKNTIANFDGATGEDDRGIWFATGTVNSIIEANNINSLGYTGTSGYGAHGITISTATTSCNNVVKNNMISNIFGDGYGTSILGDNPFGIYIFGTQTGVKVYYNSINLYGNTLNRTNALSFGIGLGTGSTADIKNNIIVNNLGLLAALGTGSIGIYLQTANTQLEACDYNNIYVNPTGTGAKYIGQIATTGYTDLATWRTASGKDLMSISVNPPFVSNNDLHIPNSSITAIESAGIPIAGITIDIDNQTRNTTKPDIGADEFAGINPAFALSGTYYIGAAGTGPGGSNPQFATLKAACDTLNTANVQGNCIFYITSNLTEPVNVSLGLDPGPYTITFKPYTGTNDTIIFTQTTDNPGVSGGWVFGTPTLSITSTTNYGLVTTNNIIVDGSNTDGGTTRNLVVQTAATSHTNTNPFRIIGDVNKCTLKNVIIKANQSVSYAVNITNRFFSPLNYTPDSIVVDNCDITNIVSTTAQGICISNSNTPTAFPNGMVFSNNDIMAKTRGIFLNYAGNTNIFGNRIKINQSATGYMSYGIWGYVIGDTANVTNIYNNHINMLSSANATTGDYGIVGIEAGSKGYYNIYNNMICGFAPTTTTANPNIKMIGIRSQAAAVSANIFYNSVYLPDVNLTPGTGTLLYAGIYISNGTNNVKNNIVVTDEADFPSYCIYRNGTNGTLVSNYNDFYYSNPLNGYVGYWNTAPAQTLADWKTVSGQDNNSISANPNFVSAFDLHLTNTSSPVMGKGINIDWITKDFDWQTRDSIPEIGADEWPGVIPVELATFTAAVNDNNVTLTWQTATEKNSSYFEIERKSDKTSWTAIGKVSATGTTTEPVNYSFTDKNVNISSASYRLKLVDLDGTYSYSTVVNVDINYLPKEFALYQNYPNPFNPSTVIKYALPFDSKVKLYIHNITGELVETIIDQTNSAGNYQVVFNCSRHASGIYFYTIEAQSIDGKNNFKSTKKMIMIK